jgi:hypothetical protein
MAKDDEPIRRMTLGNMRQHGVRGLFVTCRQGGHRHCGHERAVNLDDGPDDAKVPSFGPRMRCSHCGRLGASPVPNWIERADRFRGGPGDDVAAHRLGLCLFCFPGPERPRYGRATHAVPVLIASSERGPGSIERNR